MIAHDSADNGEAVAVVLIVVVVEDGRGRWTKSVRRNVTDYDSRSNKNTNAVWLTGREAQMQLRLTVARVSRFLAMQGANGASTILALVQVSVQARGMSLSYC